MKTELPDHLIKLHEDDHMFIAYEPPGEEDLEFIKEYEANPDTHCLDGSPADPRMHRRYNVSSARRKGVLHFICKNGYFDKIKRSEDRVALTEIQGHFSGFVHSIVKIDGKSEPWQEQL